MSKYDRKFKNVTPLEFIIGEKTIYFIGMVKEKKGPNKGKFVKQVKRSIPIDQITGVSTSALADDIVVFHLPEYDYVCENVFKTELITVLNNQYKKNTGKELNIMITNEINYTVKKTKWSSGGIYNIQFIEDASIVTNIEGMDGIPKAGKAMIKPRGKGAEIRMPPGLPASTRPVHKDPPTTNTYRAPAKKNLTLKAQIPVSNYTPPQQQVNSPSFASPPQSPLTNYTSPALAASATRVNPLSSALLAKAQNKTSIYNEASSPTSKFGKANTAKSPSSANQRTSQRISQIKKRPAPAPPPKKKLPTVKAIYAYQASEADELSFTAGDIIYVISKDDSGWWTGVKQGEQKKGLFPSNYVQEC